MRFWGHSVVGVGQVLVHPCDHPGAKTKVSPRVVPILGRAADVLHLVRGPYVEGSRPPWLARKLGTFHSLEVPAEDRRQDEEPGSVPEEHRHPQEGALPS